MCKFDKQFLEEYSWVLAKTI